MQINELEFVVISIITIERFIDLGVIYLRTSIFWYRITYVSDLIKLKNSPPTTPLIHKRPTVFPVKYRTVHSDWNPCNIHA